MVQFYRGKTFFKLKKVPKPSALEPSCPQNKGTNKMAYNKKNFYKNIISIQDKVLSLKLANEDMTFKEIYWQHIYGKMTHISYRTYYNYLAVNAKRDLKKLLEKEEMTKLQQQKELNIEQLSLF